MTLYYLTDSFLLEQKGTNSYFRVETDSKSSIQNFHNMPTAPKCDRQQIKGSCFRNHSIESILTFLF